MFYTSIDIISDKLPMRNDELTSFRFSGYLFDIFSHNNSINGAISSTVRVEENRFGSHAKYII